MKYSVHLSGRAQASLDQIYDYVARDNPAAARKLVLALEKACYGIRRFPRSYARAREDGLDGLELRHVIHGSYRIIYHIDEPRITIIDIRHSARLSLGETDP